MPINLSCRPLTRMLPSTTGETSQPARRNFANNACGTDVSFVGTSIAVRPPPKAAAAES
jgi:hypothetical protein